MTSGRSTARKPARRPAKKSAARPRARMDASNGGDAEASQRISERIAELADWRGGVLRRVRTLIHEADPGVSEEWKWQKATSPGVPVWAHAGGICTGETYKEVVKFTFFKGAALPDPARLFNSSLEGAVRRALDVREGDRLNEPAFKALVRAAVALNLSGKKG